MSAFYNENDPKAAAWLRDLISAGHIAPGVVDERSIADLKPNDLADFTQVHFFAGIGGWSLALRLAGWPDDQPVWTGSCPCQPYSAAGKGQGDADPRNLWPHMFRLVRECRPAVVFGEQVASAPVIGKRASAEDVREVLDQKIILGVLQQRGGANQDVLQGLRKQADARHQGQELQRPPAFQAGVHSDGGREVPGEQNGTAVQSGGGGHSSEDCSRLVRVDGNPFRFNHSEGLELSISGPDHARCGLHEGKRPGCDLRSECDEPQLGAGFDLGCCELDQESAAREIERLIEQLGDGTEEKAPAWVDGIRDDLEGVGYSFGACVMAASSVGAPHIRQRLYWVAQSANERHEWSGIAWGRRDGFENSCSDGGLADADPSERRTDVAGGHFLDRDQAGREQGDGESGERGAVGTLRMGEPIRKGLEGHAGNGDHRDEPGRIDAGSAGPTAAAGDAGQWLGDAARRGCGEQRDAALAGCGGYPKRAGGAGLGAWDDFAIIPCRDGKSRRIPTQPAFFPLADGIQPGRVGILRGAGNAIVPSLAAEFIGAFLDTLHPAEQAGVNAGGVQC